MILAVVKWLICLIYPDHVIIFSLSPEKHLQHIDEELTRLGQAGVTLKAAKCHFFQEQLESGGEGSARRVCLHSEVRQRACGWRQ